MKQDPELRQSIQQLPTLSLRHDRAGVPKQSKLKAIRYGGRLTKYTTQQTRRDTTTKPSLCSGSPNGQVPNSLRQTIKYNRICKCNTRCILICPQTRYAQYLKGATKEVKKTTQPKEASKDKVSRHHTR